MVNQCPLLGIFLGDSSCSLNFGEVLDLCEKEEPDDSVKLTQQPNCSNSRQTILSIFLYVAC